MDEPRDLRLSDYWLSAEQRVRNADGGWVRVRESVNVSYVARLNKGEVFAFRPPERYQFTSTKVDGAPRWIRDIWARTA